ncbi:hypothetical protein [Thioalkalivibrio thiocyanodenitrificans]|uniref:hypothetical protein n=1 Tax=Thioalkalivibrio thiocyanodenitrificans TaxID=243063 RepID=UPI00037FB4D5|nr:hypothetical protein [Thioalkalivibrio thiocyanodenitrificans]
MRLSEFEKIKIIETLLLVILGFLVASVVPSGYLTLLVQLYAGVTALALPLEALWQFKARRDNRLRHRLRARLSHASALSLVAMLTWAIASLEGAQTASLAGATLTSLSLILLANLAHHAAAWR